MWYLSCLSCTYNRRTSWNVISVMFELYLQQENVIECDICHVWAVLTTGERHRMWYLSCLSCTYNRRTSSNVISVMFELYLQQENVIECDICHVWAVLTTGERHRMWYLSCFELYLQQENVMECDICHVWAVLTTGERHGMWYLSCLSCTYKRRTSSNVISVMFELYLQQENVIECDICHVWAILTTGERHRMWYLSCLSCTYKRRTSWNVISVMFWGVLTRGERHRKWYLSCLSCTYNRRMSSNVISVMFWVVLTTGERHGMWYLSCLSCTYNRRTSWNVISVMFELYLQEENVIECDICHVLSCTYNRRTSWNVISVMFELYLQQENVMECDICHVWAVLTRGERHRMWYLSCLSCTYNRRMSSNVISVMFWAVLTRGECHRIWYLSCFELYLQEENVIECDTCHVLSCTYKRRTSSNVIYVMFWAVLTTGEHHRMWYLSCFELYL